MKPEIATNELKTISQLIYNYGVFNCTAVIHHNDFLLGSTAVEAYSFLYQDSVPPALNFQNRYQNFTIVSLLDTTNDIEYIFNGITYRQSLYGTDEPLTNMYIFGKPGEYARTELIWNNECYSIVLMFDYQPSFSVPSSFSYT